MDDKENKAERLIDIDRYTKKITLTDKETDGRRKTGKHKHEIQRV